MDASKYEQLTAYLDGELTPPERAEVERLLSQDAEARAVLEELRQVSDIVSSIPRAQAPDYFTKLVTVTLERDELIGIPETSDGLTIRAQKWSKPFAIAASLLMVVTVGWIAWPTLKSKIGQSGAVAPVSVANAPTAVEKEGLAEDRLAAATDSMEFKSPSPGARGLSPVSPQPTAADEPPGAASGLNSHSIGTTTAGSRELPGWGYAGDDRQDSTKRDDAAPATPDSSGYASVDMMLAFSSVSNRTLQETPPAAFGNSVSVETSDPEVTAELASVIESNMSQNFVKNLAESPARTEVTLGQPFYFNQQAPRPTVTAKDAETPLMLRESVDTREDAGRGLFDHADAGEAYVYYVNVPRQQAVPLLESMKKVVESRAAAAQWIANDAPVAADAVAGEVLRQADVNRATLGIGLDSEEDVKQEAAPAPAAAEAGPSGDGLADDKSAEATAAASNNQKRSKSPERMKRRGFAKTAPTNSDSESEDEETSGNDNRSTGTESTNCEMPHGKEEAKDKQVAPADQQAAGRKKERGLQDESKDKGLITGRFLLERDADDAGGTLPAPTHPTEEMITLAISLRTNTRLFSGGSSWNAGRSAPDRRISPAARTDSAATQPAAPAPTTSAAASQPHEGGPASPGSPAASQPSTEGTRE